MRGEGPRGRQGKTGAEELRGCSPDEQEQWRLFACACREMARQLWVLGWRSVVLGARWPKERVGGAGPGHRGGRVGVCPRMGRQRLHLSSEEEEGGRELWLMGVVTCVSKRWRERGGERPGGPLGHSA